MSLLRSIEWFSPATEGYPWLVEPARSEAWLLGRLAGCLGGMLLGVEEVHWSERHETFVRPDGSSLGVLNQERNEVAVTRADVADIGVSCLIRALSDAAKWSMADRARRGTWLSDTATFSLEVGDLYSVEETWLLLHFSHEPYSVEAVIAFRGVSPCWDEISISALMNRIWPQTGDRVTRVIADDGQEIRDWEITLDLCWSGTRTIGTVVDIADACQSLLQIPSTDPSLPMGIGRSTVWKLLEAGQLEWLIGESESSWLEVKSQGYDISGWAGKIELSQDVARFANAEEGGILIVGIRTKRQLGADALVKITPIALDGLSVERYRSIIDAHVYPPVDGLVVDTYSWWKGGTVLAIHVPSQRDISKPFLVQGALVDGEYEGAFISIVRRRGEGSIPVTAPAIHAYLAAGRRLLDVGRST